MRRLSLVPFTSFVAIALAGCGGNPVGPDGSTTSLDRNRREHDRAIVSLQDICDPTSFNAVLGD